MEVQVRDDDSLEERVVGQTGEEEWFGDGLDRAVMKSEASRMPSDLYLVLVVVPFIKTGGTGRGSDLTKNTTELMSDIM